VISPGARRLYQRLLALGPAGTQEVARGQRDDSRVAELAAVGLVRDVNGTLMAVPPRVARSEMSRTASRRSRELLQSAIDVESFLDRCVAVGTPTDRNHVAEIISGESEVSLLSYAVPASARHEVCSVQTAVFGEAWRTRRAVFDPSFADREISYRVVYAQACFDDPFIRQTIEDSAKQGEEARVHPAPPLKFKVMDGHSVLVPVDDTGAAGALLVNSTAVAALFADYFERLWAESAPPVQLEISGSELLKPLELRILGMLADDASDATIAARLRISERSLRRHISGALSKLGAQTRAGALAAAIRRGIVV
jgi:DNA-binding CsgD family transcriptional regulator